MKTREELNVLKKEVETLNEEELEQVTGGVFPVSPKPSVPKYHP